MNTAKKTGAKVQQKNDICKSFGKVFRELLESYWRVLGN